jgi:hypothetical protein
VRSPCFLAGLIALTHTCISVLVLLLYSILVPGSQYTSLVLASTQNFVLVHSAEFVTTTNQISGTIRPILRWDTWKSLPIHAKRISDATVPIGTDLDLHQACCVDEKENFRNFSIVMLTRDTVSQSISPQLDNGIFELHLHDPNFLTLIRWCELGKLLLSYCNSYNKQGNTMKLCSNDDCKDCCIFINIGRIFMIKYTERI